MTFGSHPHTFRPQIWTYILDLHRGFHLELSTTTMHPTSWAACPRTRAHARIAAALVHHGGMLTVHSHHTTPKRHPPPHAAAQHDAACALVAQLFHVFPHDEVVLFQCALALSKIAHTSMQGCTSPCTLGVGPPPAFFVSTLCATAFPPHEWQCLIDHVLVNGPYFLALVAAATATVPPCAHKTHPDVRKVLALAYAAYKMPHKAYGGAALRRTPPPPWR